MGKGLRISGGFRPVGQALAYRGCGFWAGGGGYLGCAGVISVSRRRHWQALAGTRS